MAYEARLRLCVSVFVITAAFDCSRRLALTLCAADVVEVESEARFRPRTVSCIILRDWRSGFFSRSFPSCYVVPFAQLLLLRVRVSRPCFGIIAVLFAVLQPGTKRRHRFQAEWMPNRIQGRWNGDTIIGLGAVFRFGS